jgi:hypothetical protein
MVWVGWVRIVGLFIRFEIMTYEQVKGVGVRFIGASKPLKRGYNTKSPLSLTWGNVYSDKGYLIKQ